MVSQCHAHEGVRESKLHAVFSSLQVISLPFSLSPTLSLSLSSSSSCLSFFRAPERHLSQHPAVNFDTCLMYASFFSHRIWVHLEGLSITPQPPSPAELSQSQVTGCNLTWCVRASMSAHIFERDVVFQCEFLGNCTVLFSICCEGQYAFSMCSPKRVIKSANADRYVITIHTRTPVKLIENSTFCKACIYVVSHRCHRASSCIFTPSCKI